MFKGTGTAIITPFNPDFSINYDNLKKVVNYQLKNNIEAIIVLGSTGEAPVIDDYEREKVIDLVVQEVNHKAKVIVGTGTNDPKHNLHHNKVAEKYNADGLLIVNPYYNKGTQRSLVEHYKYLCGQTNLPVIVYNVPSRTGMNILPDTILKIADACPNVKGVKEACGNISQIAELIANKNDDLIILSGNDDQTLPIISMGGEGVITTFGNAFPQELRLIVNLALENNYTDAKLYHNAYLKMMNLLFIETNPMPLKYMMSKLGFCDDVLRLPLISILDAHKSLIDSEYENLKNKNLIKSVN